MRTACALTVSGGVYLVLGGVLSPGGYLVQGGVPAGGGACLPEGGVPARVVYLPGGMSAGGVCARGCTYRGGVSAGGCIWQGGVPAGGACLPGGRVCLGGGCTCPGTPPLWTEFLTHAYENITLPQTSFAGGNNVFYQSSEAYFHPNIFERKCREVDLKIPSD